MLFSWLLQGWTKEQIPNPRPWATHPTVAANVKSVAVDGVKALLDDVQKKVEFSDIELHCFGLPVPAGNWEKQGHARCMPLPTCPFLPVHKLCASEGVAWYCRTCSFKMPASIIS